MNRRQYLADCQRGYGAPSNVAYQLQAGLSWEETPEVLQSVGIIVWQPSSFWGAKMGSPECSVQPTRETLKLTPVRMRIWRQSPLGVD